MIGEMHLLHLTKVEANIQNYFRKNNLLFREKLPILIQVFLSVKFLTNF